MKVNDCVDTQKPRRPIRASYKWRIYDKCPFVCTFSHSIISVSTSSRLRTHAGRRAQICIFVFDSDARGNVAHSFGVRLGDIANAEIHANGPRPNKKNFIFSRLGSRAEHIKATPIRERGNSRNKRNSHHNFRFFPFSVFIVVTIVVIVSVAPARCARLVLSSVSFAP